MLPGIVAQRGISAEIAPEAAKGYLKPVLSGSAV
jgi:hypothetical protein